jgi:hypothetical protein
LPVTYVDSTGNPFSVLRLKFQAHTAEDILRDVQRMREAAQLTLNSQLRRPVLHALAFNPFQVQAPPEIFSSSLEPNSSLNGSFHQPAGPGTRL